MKLTALVFLMIISFATSTFAQIVHAKWIVPDEIDYQAKAFVTVNPMLEIKIDLTIKDFVLNPARTRLLCNGKPYLTDGQKLGEVKLKNAGKNYFRFIENIRLPNGESLWELEITLPDLSSVKSNPMRIVLDTGKPNLYLISVGVPYALEYAQQDAAAVFDLFKTQSGHLFGSVEGELLICDKETTRGKIAQTIANLQAERLTPKDVVMLFFSGHGKPTKAFAEGDFGLVTNEASQGILEDELVLLSYQENIIKYIDPLPCKKIIFLDACHSGVAKGTKNWSGSFREAQNAISATPSGIVTIASSSGEELSYEDANWEHGSFTYALLEGLNGTADVSKDGSVSVIELSEYLTLRVPELVKKQKSMSQHPRLVRAPEVDFPIFNYQHRSVLTASVNTKCEEESGPTRASVKPKTDKVSVSVIAADGSEIDYDLTDQVIEQLKTPLLDYVVKRAGAGAVKNPGSELSSAGYVCVITKLTPVFRQDQYNGGDKYWIAQTPLKIVFYDTKSREAIYNMRIEGQNSQGTDFDKSLAASNAMEKALESLKNMKISIKN